jgi:hypothetical protein
MLDVRPDTRRMFRLPWTSADNAMTWLEPTRACNITCDACFALNDRASEKSLDRIRHELDVLLDKRRCDAMLIAGGEPLTHPLIVDVVRMVKQRGVKPVLITNGVGVDRPLVRELKRAGAYGFTFHVDSHQDRPGWKGSSEAELNELRDRLAGILYAESGLTCAFNTTIFPDTLDAVPDIVRWAVARPERVHILTLICVRMLEKDGPWRFVAGGREVDMSGSPYVTSLDCGHLTAEDIYSRIRSVLPDFEFCAFLGGTVHSDSLKWVIGCRLGSRRRSYGNAGRRFMEVMQLGHRLTRGRYLAYSSPASAGLGQLALLLGVLDPELRATARRYLADVLRHPSVLFSRLHVQSLSVVQPADIQPDGEMDTCDGCPNRTFWNELLVPACRLEEYKLFGGPLRAVPRTDVQRPS